MKKLFEIVKTNKKNIVKGALLLGGTIVAAVIAKATFGSDEDEFEVFYDVDEPEVNEVEVETTEE